MKYIISIVLFLCSFASFSQTVPQANNVPWFEFSRKLSVGQRFKLPQDTASLPSGATVRDTVGLLAMKDSMLYVLYNGTWRAVGFNASDSAFINFDLPSGYIIVDGDTTDVNIRQYLQDSVIYNQFISKESKSLWVEKIRGDTVGALNRINIGPVADSLHTRRGQLQILGNSTAYPNGVVSLYRIQNSPPNPATYQGTTVIGSLSAPQTFKNSEVFGMLSFEGTDGTTTSGTAAIREAFRMRTISVGNWSASNWGAKVRFELYPKDSISERRIFGQIGDTSYLRPTAYMWLTRGNNLGITGSTALFQTDGRMHTTKHLIEGNLRSSATSLTIVDSTYYIFTGGSDATWTLPPVGTPGRRIFIKNAGSAVLTVQRAGSDQIFTNTLVNSFALLTGADRVLVDDGVYWQTFSN